MANRHWHSPENVRMCREETTREERDQQAVLTAMIKKMVSPAILTGANGIITSVSGNVDDQHVYGTDSEAD